MAGRRELTRKRKELAESAQTATDLAVKERRLADEQHLVAHQLETLADDLSEQVSAVEAEIEAHSETPKVNQARPQRVA